MNMEENQELSYTVNGAQVVIDTRRGLRPPRWLAPVVAVALAALVLTLPFPAFGFFEDEINSWANSTLEGIAGAVNSTADKGWFTADFTTLIPGSSDTALYNMAETVAKGTIYPTAACMLSLAFLLQLLKIAQRIDGNSAVPAIKEIFILYVVLALCAYAVGHSFGLARDFFDVVNSWNSGLKANSINTLELTADLKGDVGAAIYLALLGCGVNFILLLANILIKVMVIARAVQIYLYSMFSPLMLSMLGLDEMRHWAMGYIKGFLACCLSGFVMYFALCAYPVAMAGILGQAATVSGNVYALSVTPSTVSQSFTSICCLTLAMALLCINSGTYARDILGG